MIKWRVYQKRDKQDQGSSVTLEKGYKRIRGSVPQTIETIDDVLIEILEGGFLEEDENGRVVRFSIVEEGEYN